MVLTTKARWWALVFVTVLSLGGAVAHIFPQPQGCIRPRSLTNRVECRLEQWGIIPHDPFRHIEG
jgi:hypothetical protein